MAAILRRRGEWDTQNYPICCTARARTGAASRLPRPTGSTERVEYMDAKTPASHGANTKSAQLTIGGTRRAFLSK